MNTEIPDPDFTEKDVDSLINHYQKPIEEKRKTKIFEDLEAQRGKFKSSNKDISNERETDENER